MDFKTGECSEEERERFIQLHCIVRDAGKIQLQLHILMKH